MRNSRPFTWIASGVFAIVALCHLYRVVTNMQLIIGSHSIPMWVSYGGIVVPALLSWMLCREARGTTGP
jgi:hypothetical protein